MYLQDQLKNPLIRIALLLGLFYIAWSPFWAYDSYYSIDEEFFRYIQISQVDNPFVSCFSFLFSFLYKTVMGGEIRYSMLRGVIFGIHFFNCVVFHFLFDRKSRTPLATFTLLLCPILFYDLSITDLKQTVVYSFAIFYLYIALKKNDFSYKNVVLISLLFLCALLNNSFVLIVLVDLFLSRFSKNALLRFVAGVAIFIIFSYYSMFLQNNFLAISAFSFKKGISTYFSYIKYFFATMIEFSIGKRGFGFAILERDPAIMWGTMKVIGAMSFLGILIWPYQDKKKIVVSALIFTAAVGLYSYFSNDNYILLSEGLYFNSLVFKASTLFPFYFLAIIYIAENKEYSARAGSLILVLSVVAWLNMLPLTSKNTYQISRTESPVFWGMIDRYNLKFNKNFSSLYPNHYSTLPRNDQIVADGIEQDLSKGKVIDINQENFSALFKVDYLLNNRKYTEGFRELLSLLTEGIISKEEYLRKRAIFREDLALDLERTIIPLIYELKYAGDDATADSLYFLGLYNYTLSNNSLLKGKLINEFGPPSKQRR